MANPTITVSPDPDELGVPLGESVEVTFDTEIDMGSILAGNIVISGIIDQIWSGPDLITYERLNVGNVAPYLLSDPTFMGPLEYDTTILRVDSNGDTVSIIDDGTGGTAGEMYYTKVILTPKQTLKPNVKYGVIISTNITKNTVFDTVYTLDPGSSGRAVFTGPYLGAAADQFVVQITGGTSYLDMTFDWWKTSDPLTITSVNTANKRSSYLSDGITVNFDTGTFLTGDQMTANVIAQDKLEDIYNWSFITGSGSIKTPSASTSAILTEIDLLNGIGSATPNTPTGFEGFISTNPTADSYQNTPPSTITIRYGSDINAIIVDASKIHVVQEILIPDDIFCTGDPSTQTMTPVIRVSGQNVTLSGMTFSANAIVTVTIDEGFLTLLNGNQAKAESFDFMTAFTVFYSTPSYIKFRAGNFLGGVPDVLLAEKIGIISVELRQLFIKCFSTMCSASPEVKQYFGAIVRQYVTDRLLMEILQNNGNLVPMSKSIDTFRVSFGSNGKGSTGGKAGPLYDDIAKSLKANLVAIRSCMKLGPGQRQTPIAIEKAINSPFPGLRGRDMYINSGKVPGLNSLIEFYNYRIRTWGDTLGG